MRKPLKKGNWKLIKIVILLFIASLIVYQGWQWLQWQRQHSHSVMHVDVLDIYAKVMKNWKNKFLE